ncbi:MAG: hemerythrin family protein [Rhodospirillales bacterium]|nr:hemerythrin family protein [Rhodospirillales bacterium]
MPIIHWTLEFSVGVNSLDTDHKVLISLINQLDDAVRGGESSEIINRVLDALLDYTDYHFGREEALMRACGYPDIEAHIRTHATLRAQVQEIRDRYRRNSESIHGREVLSFLKNWLTAHIVGRDKLYVPFMQQAAEKVQSADRVYGEDVEAPKAMAAAGPAS